jgi:hypothetical protein
MDGSGMSNDRSRKQLRSHVPRADRGVDFDVLVGRSRSPVLRDKHEGVA